MTSDVVLHGWRIVQSRVVTETILPELEAIGEVKSPQS